MLPWPSVRLPRILSPQPVAYPVAYGPSELTSGDSLLRAHTPVRKFSRTQWDNKKRILSNWGVSGRNHTCGTHRSLEATLGYRTTTAPRQGRSHSLVQVHNENTTACVRDRSFCHAESVATKTTPNETRGVVHRAPVRSPPRSENSKDPADC